MKDKNPKLNIVENVYDDQDTPKGKKDRFTKFYSIYVYKVLTEDASKDEPLKVLDILEIIKEKFKVILSKDTIQEYIRLFKIHLLPNYTLEGNPYDGYYLTSDNEDILVPGEFRLDDIEINILIQMLRKSRLASDGAKKNIIEKLSYSAGSELKEFLNKHSYFSKDINFNIQKNLFAEDMIEIINQRRPIMLQRKLSNGKVNSTFRRFNIYAFIPFQDTYCIVGAPNCGNVANFLTLNQINKYYVLEDETFDKTPLHIRMSTMFTTDEVLETLKTEHPNDFIFPTKEEMQRHKQDFANRLKNRKKEKEEKKEND